MLQWFISFSEFTEFNESSAPFRKNSIELDKKNSIWKELNSDQSKVILI